MFITEQPLDADSTISLYSYGNCRIMVIDCPESKIFWRREWQHDYDMAELPFYMGSVFINLPSRYFAHPALEKFWKKYLTCQKVSSGPSHYENQIPGLNVIVKNPVTGASYPLSAVIIELNDYHKWTREKIADWLETLDENPILNNPKENDV